MCSGPRGDETLNCTVLAPLCGRIPAEVMGEARAAQASARWLAALHALRVSAVARTLRGVLRCAAHRTTEHQRRGAAVAWSHASDQPGRATARPHALRGRRPYELHQDSSSRQMATSRTS